MKKLTLFFLVAGLAMACNKDQNSSRSSNNNPFSGILKLIGANMTTETQRIYDEMNEADYEFTIISTSNFGMYSEDSPEENYLLGGVTPETMTVDVNGIHNFDPNLGEDSYLYQGIDFSSLYGNTIDIAGTDYQNSNNDFLETFYVPLEIRADNLGENGTNFINEDSPMALGWVPDPNNPTDQVAILYELYVGDLMESEPVEKDVILTADNGSYDLNEIINSNNNVTQIRFTLTRGNSALVSTDIGNVFVNVRSEDHHIYDIVRNP
ncbi:MAG: hypothetical protein RLP14_08200 [Owenweeksia sp.]